MQDDGSRQMYQCRILLLHLLRDGGDISRDDVRFRDDVHLHDDDALLFPPPRLLVALCHESIRQKLRQLKFEEVGMDNLIQVYICIITLYNFGTGLQGADNLFDTF